MPNAENDAPTRRSVNGHTLELRATYWRCLQCDHRFENAADAEGFWCGDDCTGRHIPPGEPRCNPVGGVHALWCPDRVIPPAENTLTEKEER